MKKSYLLTGTISLILAATACTKKKENNQNSPNLYRTPEVMQKVSGQKLRFGKTILSFSGNGSFELLMDTHVRHFPEGSRKPKAQQLSARCLIKLSGASTFYNADYGSEMPELTSNFNIESAELISSERMYEHDDTYNSQEVCTRYVENLTKTKVFTQHVHEYSQNSISFLSFDFGITDPQEGGWLFNAWPMSNGYDISRTWTLTYFVKDGTTVDVTTMVTKDLNGTHVQTHGGRGELTVSPIDKSITYTNTECGLLYRIYSIFVDGDSLKANFKNLNSQSAVLYSKMNTLECSTLKDSLENQDNTPVKMGYRISSYSKEVTKIWFESNDTSKKKNTLWFELKK